MTKRIFLLATFLFSLAVGPATAASTKIKFASPSPPRAHLNVQIFGPWIKKLNADSKGTIEAELVAGRVLASHQNLYDRVKTNVAQIGWSLQGFLPGKFIKSNVVAVPSLFESSKVGSGAMWRLFERGLISDEYSDVKVLSVFTFPPRSFHSNEPIKTLEDLKGVKIGGSGPIGLSTIKALGATPVFMVTPKLYQNISRGLVNGIFTVWTAFQPYRLYEVTKYHTQFGLGGFAGMVVMNKQTYDGLVGDARRAIDANSYASLTKSYSSFWDRIFSEAVKKYGGGEGHTLVNLSDAERARWEAKLQPVIDDWVNKTPNGAEILQAFKEEIAKIKAGK